MTGLAIAPSYRCPDPGPGSATTKTTRETPAWLTRRSRYETLHSASTLDFVSECLLFEAFPIDVIVTKEFGAQSDAIIGLIFHRLFEALGSQFVVPEDRDRFRGTEQDFENLRVTRLTEYADAWRSASGGQSLERLGALAWKRISGSPDVPASSVFLLAARVTAAFKAFAGVGTRIEIVSG